MLAENGGIRVMDADGSAGGVTTQPRFGCRLERLRVTPLCLLHKPFCTGQAEIIEHVIV